MKQRIIIGALLVAALAAIPGFLLGQPQSMNLWAGAWKLNLAKSTYQPGPPPQTATVVNLEVVHGLLRITSNGTNAQGTPNQTVTYVRFDGKEQPLVNTDLTAQPVTRIYKYIDDHDYEWVTKVNGQVTTTTRLILAADRKTHTLTTTGKNAQGQTVNNVTVFDKQ